MRFFSPWYTFATTEATNTIESRSLSAASVARRFNMNKTDPQKNQNIIIKHIQSGFIKRQFLSLVV